MQKGSIVWVACKARLHYLPSHCEHEGGGIVASKGQLLPGDRGRTRVSLSSERVGPLCPDALSRPLCCLTGATGGFEGGEGAAAD